MIKFDYHSADASVVGVENGLNIKQEFEEYKSRISDIILDLNRRKDKPGQGLRWMNLGYSEETAWYVKEYAALVQNRFDNILVLGIGGSVLGGRAVTEALLDPYWNFLTKEQRNNIPRIFFLDNIDPDEILSLLQILDLKKTLLNVITKSGDTAEIMAQFMIIANKMEEELGDDYRKNIVATTDKRTGILRQISEQEGYKTFVIPDDVGGRFSVFSAVGLLPFALLGIDIDEITAGIRDMDFVLKNPNIYENIAAQNALIHYLLDIKKGKNISVMMPYSRKLKYVADWYVQLWAESLGKCISVDGKNVNVGQTPLKAVGATDQHSLLQLFNEGPNNKIINFINVENFNNNIGIPEVLQYTGVGYLGGKPLSSLLCAEFNSTRASLLDYSRPNVTIYLPHIDGYHVAQLLYMFEIQTAVAGALYNVDAFNQPGVEQSKNYTYALMDRAGYEESARILKSRMSIF